MVDNGLVRPVLPMTSRYWPWNEGAPKLLKWNPVLFRNLAGSGADPSWLSAR